MLPTEPHRKHRFFHNVYYLLLALLTYIVFLLFLYRNSLPIQERTTVQRQGKDVILPNANDEKRPMIAQEEIEDSAVEDDWVLPSQSQASLQPSPGVVWLMSFGGSVRRTRTQQRSKDRRLANGFLTHLFLISGDILYDCQRGN